MSDEEAHIDTKEDAAKRRERDREVQLDTLSDIDKKAEYITRLTAIIIGIIVAATQVSDGIIQSPLTEPSLPFLLSLGTGVALLLISLLWSIVTYSGSNIYPGLSPESGQSIANDPIPYDWHIEELVVLYSNIIEENEETIQTDSFLMTRSLIFLLGGLIFVAIATVLLLNIHDWTEWMLFLIVGPTLSLASALLIRNKEDIYNVDQGRRPR